MFVKNCWLSYKRSFNQKRVEALIENNINYNFSDLAEIALAKPCLRCDFMKVNFFEEEVDPVTKLPKSEIELIEMLKYMKN